MKKKKRIELGYSDFKEFITNHQADTIRGATPSRTPNKLDSHPE